MGGGQRGLAGEALPDRVVVRVVDSESRPVVGRRVDFQVVAGGGAVRPTSGPTDATGRTGVEWSLGGREVRIQRLRATVADGPTVTVEATALGEEETDVILLRGALGPMKGVVLLDEVAFGNLPSRLEIVQERVTADTVVPIQPMDAGSNALVVFPWANALEWRTVTWTPGIDTVRVDLRPPVPIRARVGIGGGEFTAVRDLAERQLAVTERVWREEGVGLTLADVEFFGDGGEAGSRVEVPDDCTRPDIHVPEGVLKILFVGRVGSGTTAGWACRPDATFVATGIEPTWGLVAHELGHLFSLEHTTRGLMWPGHPNETALSEGEIFRIHFNRESAVNVVFEAQPPEARRECRVRVEEDCLPVDYELR